MEKQQTAPKQEESKREYKIRNWSQYNKALIKRGDINVWISDDADKSWYSEEKTGKKGRPAYYSDHLILTALMIRGVFHLPLRALEGFMSSMAVMLKVAMPVPSYSQISRRSGSLGESIKRLQQGGGTDLVIDSTGLKIYGEGEWKVKKHGSSKRRTWKKLHLAVCPKTHSIVMQVLTDNATDDAEVYTTFLENAPKSVERTYADGAYDKKKCYEAVAKHGSNPIIPPRRNAVITENAPAYIKPRDKACKEIEEAGGGEEGLKAWKKSSGYHTRSLVETAMGRFKQLLGGNLRSRKLSTQQGEIAAKCHALNIMTSLGMPEGEWIIAKAA